MSLLSVNADSKTIKGTKLGILTGILYLAPSNESGAINTCPNASAGCRAACLFTAGRGAFNSVKNARIAKTLKFVADREAFLRELIVDITALVRKAKKQDMKPAIRLNGTSDLAWESFKVDGKNLMEHFPDVQFYDYTKSPSRMGRFATGQMPVNYHLTFSRSEENAEAVSNVLKTTGNVAVVFRGQLPATYQGRPVINGDESDVRFGDAAQVIVGLVQKGKARKDASGFVVEPVAV
jgi:hypothetical protein